MKWLIYKHTNEVNGKVYIGQTCRDIKQRWGGNGTNYLTKNNNGKYLQPKFAKAIIKYGWNNFSHKIIENNIKTQDEANEREIYYIQLYDSVNKGYNITYGGDNHEHLQIPIFQIDMKTLKPIKEWKGVRQAQAYFNPNSFNISGCLCRRKQSAYNFYWCYKSEYKYWKPLNYKSKLVKLNPIYCLETKTSYDNLSSIFDDNRIKLKDTKINRQVILSCCYKTRKSLNGYHFCYKQDYISNNYNFDTNYCSHEDRVKKDKQLIKFFVECKITDLKRLSLLTNQSENTIYYSLRRLGLINKTKYIWTKKEDDFLRQNYSRLGKKKCAEILHKTENAVTLRAVGKLNLGLWKQSNSKILCVETKVIYNSLLEANKKTLVDKSTIIRCCKGQQKTAGGYHWKYID